MLFNKRETLPDRRGKSSDQSHYIATQQWGIRDKRDSCEMIDGYAIVPRELQVTRGLAAACFAVNGFSFRDVKGASVRLLRPPAKYSE